MMKNPHETTFQALWRQALQGSRLLMGVAASSSLLLAVCLAMQMLDARMIDGVSVWAKPAKFAASVVAGAPVLAWILWLVGPQTKGRRIMSSIFAGAFVLELVLITMQAARGVPSHFNVATRFDGFVFTVMGAAITLFWLTQLWLTYKSFRHTFANRVIGWSVRWALLIASLGAAVAFAMPQRVSPKQQEAVLAGQATTIGGHAVGVEDGGPGLPVTRWSVKGGDLRVPHFLGLHALQILPLLGWAVSRRRPRKGVRIVNGIGVAYLGLVVTTFVQAQRARPLHAPDAVTLWLLAAVVAVAAAVLWWPRRRAELRQELRVDDHRVHDLVA
ncbi:MAG: hypothetical protein SF187_05250 [Deltaproteobacteria bacterium]|nr:hypothetical protein [Deltaproteobacteria bacterium]